jgi:hypothetical protein
MQKKNEKFQDVAGFDGRGGHHGSGGHGGNQIKPKELKPEVERAQATLMKQHLKNRVSPAAISN